MIYTNKKGFFIQKYASLQKYKKINTEQRAQKGDITPPTDSTNKHGYAEYQCRSVKSVGTKPPTDEHGSARKKRDINSPCSQARRDLNYPN